VAERVITSFEELQGAVGQETGVSDWFEITQDRVNQFAEATGDHQWIHVDTEKAKGGPFGGTIAHGFLTLSMGSLLRAKEGEGIKVQLGGKMGVNYGLNKVRFMSPVKVGKRVRARRMLVNAEKVGDNVIQTTTQVTIEIEGEQKPAMVAEQLARQYL
jgi:acyl dehydratase